MQARSGKRPRRFCGAALTTALLLSLNSAALAGAPEDWQRFDSDAGRFSVELPTTPVQVIKKRGMAIASFASHVYTALVGEDAFGVNHTDLPRIALLFASRKKIFDSARNGFLEDAHATQVSYGETLIDGRPGRELVYDIPAQAGRPPLRGTARMLFEGKRLYIFWAEVTRQRAANDLGRFFRSIRLLGR